MSKPKKLRPRSPRKPLVPAMPAPHPRSKVVYQCPTPACRAKVWGRPDLVIVCGTCGEPFGWGAQSPATVQSAKRAASLRAWRGSFSSGGAL